MSSPARRIVPVSCLSVPQIGWMSVDLPAPFGPISAWISPGRRSSETSSVARNAPKDLLRLESSRTGSAMTLSMPGLSGEKPHKAAARKEHRAEQDQAKEGLPALRQSAQHVFEDHEQHGTGQRPEQTTDT